MPELPEVTQPFVADVSEYVYALERAIAAARDFVDANREAVAAAKAFAEAAGSMAEATAAADRLASATREEMAAAAAAAAADREEAQALQEVARAAAQAAAAETAVGAATREAAADAAAATSVWGTLEEAIHRANERFRMLDQYRQDVIRTSSELKTQIVTEAAATRIATYADYQAVKAASDAIKANIERAATEQFVASEVRARADALSASLRSDYQSVVAASELTKANIELGSVLQQVADRAGLLRARLDAETSGYIAASNAVKEFINQDRSLAGGMEQLRINLLSQMDMWDHLRINLAGVEDQIMKANIDYNYLGSTIKRTNVDIGDTGSVFTKSLAGWKTWLALIPLTVAQLHWVVGLGFELLAVVVPAFYALAAAAFVALQGFNQVRMHMQALYTATEATSNMLHTTIGSALGLGNALQQAQNKANPMVYQVLGAALNIAGSRMSAFGNLGVQVMQNIDRFAAKVAIEMRGAFGGRLISLLGNAASDLSKLMGVFGNLAHAAVNVASAMPGIATVLLAILNAATGLIQVISGMPSIILTMLLAWEEAYRYGGVLNTMFRSLTSGVGLLIGKLAQGVGAFSNFAKGMAAADAEGSALGGLMGRIGVKAESAATGMSSFGAKIESVAKAIPGWGWALAAVTVVIGVGLAFALSHAKSEADKFVQAMDRATQATSDYGIIAKLTDNIGQYSAKLAQANAQMAQVTKNTALVIPGIGQTGIAFTNAQTAANKYNSMLSVSERQQINVAQGAAAIMRTYGVSFPAALGIAQRAGINLGTTIIKLGKDSNIAGQMIMNSVRGYQAMGVPMGVLGADLNVIAVQSGLAATQVQTLMQATQQYLSSLATGMGNFAQFATAVKTMKSDVAATSTSLKGQFGSISGSAANLKFTLQGLSSASMQSWQQFSQAYQGPLSGLVTWLQQAGAEGLIAKGQFTTAIKAMVQVLLPLAAHSGAARGMLQGLASMAGINTTGSMHSLRKATHLSGNAMKILEGIISGVTQNMGNLSKVAANLGNVVLAQMDKQLASTIINSTGLNQAIQKYGQDLANSHTPGYVLQQDLARIQYLQQVAQQRTDFTTQSLQKQAGQAAQTTKALDAMRIALSNLHSRTINVVTNMITKVQPGYPGPGAPGHHVGHGQHGGVLPGFLPGRDTVPMMLSAGESVLNPWATQMLGTGTVHAINRFAESNRAAAGMSFGAPGGGGTPAGDVIVQVDGRELFRVVAAQGYKYNMRNSGKVTGLLKPT